ncbi:hypothetical protein STIAU_3595 [Stigmatella aurantiaca DW4/3-1]|uniref:Uncharacterized protein n=1 Tax=Stigmatella aurantiaca (strain DW4/3-1) TaxID=378806 RepID=Q092F1_STIAD|nr:hypothetical protein STIAU_3595 [Stigmatella aurantiaca DW4/3-1]
MSSGGGAAKWAWPWKDSAASDMGSSKDEEGPNLRGRRELVNAEPAPG